MLLSTLCELQPRSRSFERTFQPSDDRYWPRPGNFSVSTKHRKIGSRSEMSPHQYLGLWIQLILSLVGVQQGCRQHFDAFPCAIDGCIQTFDSNLDEEHKRETSISVLTIVTRKSALALILNRGASRCSGSHRSLI